MSLDADGQNKILLESGTNELEIVEFQLYEPGDNKKDRETGFYGINVAKVREIIKPPKFTQVPNSHSCIKGMFNFRGTVIPLVNLSHWLGKDEYFDDRARTIVVEFNNMINGFLVHGVNRIHRISWEQVETTASLSFSHDQDTIIGGVKFDDRIIMLLDFEKIISELNPSLQINILEPDLEKIADDRKRGNVNHDAVILIADDSAIIRRLLSEVLLKAGFKIKIATNGLEAFHLMQKFYQDADEKGCHLSELIQLVITDIEMPQMDGMHLTKRLKNDEKFSSLPVIIFSSIASEENRVKARKVGADGYISKPEMHNLLTLVNSMLS